ncbi:unnamed protein product [Effrenium voratum]|uniref:Uncharacterized protein n=1 Tax=Effrenium voratum TaxID=2562239 RepID=A0AA36JMR7_9DINO|nr:unnamed protein product [Effrenium voratum]
MLVTKVESASRRPACVLAWTMFGCRTSAVAFSMNFAKLLTRASHPTTSTRT